MAENFLQKAPVGTKVFNKEDKMYYVKVSIGEGKNKRDIWKVSRGSRITSPFRDLTIDNKGRKFTYVDNEGKTHTAETGDDIKDYLQSGKGMIQIKDGKYLNPDNSEYKGLKISNKKNQVYTIESFNTPTGKGLSGELTIGNNYRSYLDSNKQRTKLEKEIARLEKIPLKRRRMSSNFDANLQNLKNELESLGPAKPFNQGVDSNTGGIKDNRYDVIPSLKGYQSKRQPERPTEFPIGHRDAFVDKSIISKGKLANSRIESPLSIAYHNRA